MKHFRNAIECDACAKRERKSCRKIGGLEREVDPFAEQSDPAMSGPVEEIIADQMSNVVEDPCVARGMEPMTSVVDRQASKLKAPGVPSNDIALLQHNDVRFLFFGESPGGTYACRSAAENCDACLCHLQITKGMNRLVRC